MIQPHGKHLIHRLVDDEDKQDRIKTASETMPTITLNENTYQDLENLATGVFSPLEGFMTHNQVTSLLDNDRLPDDTPWTMPILLDVNLKTNSFQADDEVALRYQDNTVGILAVEDIYDIDREFKQQLAQHVFGTTEAKHPGVADVYALKNRLVGGKIELLEENGHPYRKFQLTPRETRTLFQEKGWETIVGFQTRNVPHLGHEFVQKTSLAVVDGLFVNPLIGKKKAGDFLDNVILGAYKILMSKYYVPEHSVMSILTTRMRYGGPKEAIHHAIMRKNFGCTHFIVGRDHAGVGDYYGPYDAHAIFDRFPDLGIQPICFRAFSYCKKCGSAVMDKQCPHDPDDHILFSGTKMRRLLREKKRPGKLMMRPEVVDFLLEQDQLFVE